MVWIILAITKWIKIYFKITMVEIISLAIIVIIIIYFQPILRITIHSKTMEIWMAIVIQTTYLTIIIITSWTNLISSTTTTIIILTHKAAAYFRIMAGIITYFKITTIILMVITKCLRTIILAIQIFSIITIIQTITF